jgi:hypothetical protein
MLAVILGQIDLVLEQMVQGKFEGTGEKLAGKIYGQKARTVIDHLEARHRVRSPTMAMHASCACKLAPAR